MRIRQQQIRRFFAPRCSSLTVDAGPAPVDNGLLRARQQTSRLPPHGFEAVRAGRCRRSHPWQRSGRRWEPRVLKPGSCPESPVRQVIELPPAGRDVCHWPPSDVVFPNTSQCESPPQVGPLESAIKVRRDRLAHHLRSARTGATSILAPPASCAGPVGDVYSCDDAEWEPS